MNREIKSYPNQLQMLRNSKYNQAAEANLGMAWYKFTIYFRMIYSVLMHLSEILGEYNIILRFSYISLVNAVGIVWILFTRHWMRYFERKGVINYFVIQYGLPVLNLLISLLLLLTGDASLIPEALATVILSMIIFIPEIIYWKKRIHLFDKHRKTFLTCAKSGDDNIIFCRRCGKKLSENSSFCSECGTEIIKIKDGYGNEM